MRGESPSILVTGSSGTIGTALTSRLLTAGYETTGVDVVSNPWLDTVDKRTVIADLRNEEELAALPTDIDLIVHLGAHARVHNLVTEPELARENIDITFNILDFARKNGVPGVVFASSREVYGNRGGVVREERTTRIDKSESPYSASKASGEALVSSFASCYDLSASILRFSNVYGRYDRSDRVIPLFITKSARGEPLTVYGEEKILDFTYLDDCVDGISRVIDQFPKAAGRTFNIASGEGTSLVELAREIDDQTPNSAEIRIEPTRNGEVGEFIADISAAKKLLGYSPSYGLEAGLSETVDWYLDRPGIREEIARTETTAEESQPA